MNYAIWLRDLLQTLLGWEAAGKIEMVRNHVLPPADRGEIVKYFESVQIPIIDEIVDFYSQATSECDILFYKRRSAYVDLIGMESISCGFRIGNFREVLEMKETLLNHLSYAPNYDASDKRKLDAVGGFSWPIIRFPSGALIFYMQPNTVFDGGYYAVSVEKLHDEAMPFKFSNTLSELLTFSEKSCYILLEPDEVGSWWTKDGLKYDERLTSTLRNSLGIG